MPYFWQPRENKGVEGVRPVMYRLLFNSLSSMIPYPCLLLYVLSVNPASQIWPLQRGNLCSSLWFYDTNWLVSSWHLSYRSHILAFSTLLSQLPLVNYFPLLNICLYFLTAPSSLLTYTLLGGHFSGISRGSKLNMQLKLPG